MKIVNLAAAALVAAQAVATLAVANDGGTKEEAIAMTRKAVAAVKADKAKAFAEISSGSWKDRDLYPMVYNAKGVNESHGANPKLIGKDLSELKDADGKLIVKCIIDAGEKNGGKGAWCDYKWPNPVTKVVEAKSTYVEKAGDLYVGVGIYAGK